jgi:hypothetical protein
MLAAVPFVFLAGAIMWQLALVGHAAWMAAHAARAGARAAVVGRSAPAAARSSLPRSLERGLDVDSGDGRVRVRIRVPMLIGRSRPVTVSASSALGPPP